MRTEYEHLCERLNAKGLNWPKLGHVTWVMMFGRLLPIATALVFVLVWIVILIQIRMA